MSEAQAGEKLVYNGPYGGAVPFSGAPSGRTYEAGKNSPNVTADPQDVEWLMARGFQRETNAEQAQEQASVQQSIKPEVDINTMDAAQLQAFREQIDARLREQVALDQSDDPSKEYPNNAVLRVSPENANTVRPDSDTDALREQQAHTDDPEQEPADDEPKRRAGRPRKTDSE